MTVTPKTFWIETYSGLKFDIQNPDPSMVCLADVAHALANTCRYNGHCKRFYSVAEHSVHVARFIRDLGFNAGVAFAALMHDACEAYTGDFPSPFKWMIPELQTIENAVQRAVHAYFSLDTYDTKHKVIDATDKRIVLDERKVLMTSSGHKWAIDGLEPLGVRIECWGPEVAENRFLTLFQILDAARNKGV